MRQTKRSLRAAKRAVASVDISNVDLSFCGEDIPGASFHVFSLRLDSKPLANIAFMHSNPVFCACTPFMKYGQYMNEYPMQVMNNIKP